MSSRPRVDGGAPALSPAEEEELAETKSSLFGNRARKQTATEDGKHLATGSATATTTAAASTPSASAAGGSSSSSGGVVVGGLPADLFELDAGGALDLTTQDIDLEGIGGDLRSFEQHELVKEALEKEKDFRNYSREIDKELAEYEHKCVEDYLADADQLSTLHGQIKSCDSILATMESMLSHFQSDLSAISTEIQFLQEKSYGMNIKLRNYKGAEKKLNNFIQHIYIPDDLCNVILEGEMNEAFVTALIELDKKLLFLEKCNKHHPHHGDDDDSVPYSLAARDMQPIGEKLKLKAVSRIRAFLLERFHALKKPKTNIQIKQKLLLKFGYFYQFLLHHADDQKTGSTGGGSHNSSYSNLHASPLSSTSGDSANPTAGMDICGEIRREYHETMSVIYHSKFKKYLSELKKLQADSTVEKGHTLAYDIGTSGAGGAAGGDGKSSSSGGLGGMFSGMFSSKKSGAQIDNVFRLQGREEVLLGSSEVGGVQHTGPSALGSVAQANMASGGAANDRDLIIPHIAAGSGALGKINFEKLFRSAQSLLMDTATSEYDFIVEFFGERMQREMDRAGQHEDALEAEKTQSENDHKSSGSKHDAYSTSSNDERGREHLAPHSRDKHLFQLVFGKTIQLFLDHLESFLFSCHDALCILLLIRIVCQHNIQMQYRRVHCLDAVFDRMNMSLWPRFKHIFDENVASVMKVPFTDIKGLTTTGSTPKSRVHIIGTRYAEFASGILQLNAGYNDDILIANLKRLRGEVDKFFLRSAARVSPPKLQLIFLLNNYHSILCILGSAGAGESEDAKYWENQAGLQIGLLVEEEIGEKFPTLLTFIKISERSLSDEENAASRNQRTPDFSQCIDLKTFVKVVQEFAKNWRGMNGIEGIYQNVMKHFSMDEAAGSSSSSASPAAAAAKSGAGRGGSNAPSVAASSSALQIFMQILSQLLVYNQRLDNLWQQHIKQRFNNQPDERKNIQALLVPNAAVLIEIKKYSKQ